MKTIKHFLALLLVSISSLIIASPCTHPQMNVSAHSGLNMRTVPGAHGQVIMTIPYGAAVTMVNDEMELGFEERIDWVDGRWILVEYDGEIGYVFDGFLTQHNVPTEVDEFSCEDIDLSEPLESWMKNNFKSQAAPDTIMGSNVVSISNSFIEGHSFKEKDKEYHYEVVAELQQTNVMEAYHLLYNMLISRPEKLSFVQHSTFVEDREGKISRVKVDIEYPIHIKQLPNQTVAIRIVTFKSGCTL